MIIDKNEVERLVDLGLLYVKKYTEGVYKGLSVLKYTRKCFFDNQWYVSPLLLECRGLVIDENYKVIVRPLKKVFNVGENNTQLDPNKTYETYLKVNGFMCAVTYTADYGMIVSTTGTLDSNYVEMAKELLSITENNRLKGNYTLVYEICHPEDPHIIQEELGVYFLGYRDIDTGEFYPNVFLSQGFTKGEKLTSPEYFKNDKTEGRMIFEDGVMVAKMKSPYYLSKKAIQRMGLATIRTLFDDTDKFKQRIDEEFYELVDDIVSCYTKESWYEFTEQERSTIITDYFEGKWRVND